MEPSDFLTRDEFDQLSAEEAARYAESLARAVREAEKNPDAAPDYRVAVTSHWLAVVEWVLPPEEFDRRVRRVMWDELWGHADEIVRTWEELLASPEVPETEKPKIRERLAQARDILEHKRSLDEWGASTD